MIPTIDVYLWPKDLKTLEKFPSYNIFKYPLSDWLQEDFGRYCLQNIDSSVYVGGSLLHNDTFGEMSIEHIAGATATLLIAYHEPDYRMPLTNCGDNCGDAIYRCSQDVRTKWYWEGYCPDLNPMQFVHFPELETTVLGQDAQRYLIDSIPYELTLRYKIYESRKKRGEI